MLRPIRNGITLIEVIVIIVIILVLIGLFLPATRRVRESSDRTKCMNNLRQLIMAVDSFESNVESDTPSAQQQFPPGCIGPGTTPEERLSWIVKLLPYLDLEQNDLYQKFDLEKGYEGNLPAAETRIRLLICPLQKKGETQDAVTDYIAMSGIGVDAAKQPAGATGNGFMGYDRVTTSSMIKDGRSNTIALMETRSGLGPWTRGGSSNLRGFDPTDLPLYGDERPFNGHSVGMNAAMADGSVLFLRSDIDPAQLAAAITINGGEPKGSEW